jgi:hypothetical protein
VVGFTLRSLCPLGKGFPSADWVGDWINPKAEVNMMMKIKLFLLTEIEPQFIQIVTF